MASPGVISRTSAVLASSHAVAAGSIVSNSGSLQDRREHRVRVSAALPNPHGRGTASAGLDEVLIRARRGRAALALILGASLRTAVGVLGGAGQPEQAELADLH